MDRVARENEEIPTISTSNSAKGDAVQCFSKQRVVFTKRIGLVLSRELYDANQARRSVPDYSNKHLWISQQLSFTGPK